MSLKNIRSGKCPRCAVSGNITTPGAETEKTISKKGG